MASGIPCPRLAHGLTVVASLNGVSVSVDVLTVLAVFHGLYATMIARASAKAL
jgi:hypothetical protein